MPGMEKTFFIFCDASGQGLGCVIMQDGLMVAYASRQLRKREEHYLTPNLELAIVVHVLKIWRYYLAEKRCELYTDHKSLNYIFTQLNPSHRQQKRLDLIKDYDPGINYYPRNVNVVADAWSQRTHLRQLDVEIIDRSSCASSSTTSTIGLLLI
jgi:hypothetical protein